MSSDVKTELIRTWPVLERPAGPGVSASVIGSSPDGRLIRVGVDAAGARHFIVPTTEADSPVPRRTDGALTVAARILRFDGLNTETIDVRCSRSDMFDLFDELCLAIMDEVATSDNAAETAARAVERWRELLRARSSATQLDAQVEIGLFGELVLAESMSQAGFRDIAMWRGPLGALQDFQLDDFWVEVKTTAGSPRVRVHGIEQLEELDGIRGFLAVVRLAAQPTGRTVSEIVATLASSFPLDELEDRLLHAGWSAATESGRRWSVIGTTIAPAAAAPRIVPSSIGGVPQGISGVDYDISLESLLRVSRPAPEMLEELRQTYGSS